MEANEMQEYSERLKEAGEASLTRVSVIISVLAVLVALVTVLSHREHTEAVLSQARASDRWSEYQGRRIRQSEAALLADWLTAVAAPSPQGTAEQTTQFKAQLTARQKALQEQLDDDSREAKSLEQEVTRAERRAARFDMGEALLQIAVILASVTLLTKRGIYVLAAAFLGLAGIAAGAAAFLIH